MTDTFEHVEHNEIQTVLVEMHYFRYHLNGKSSAEQALLE